MYSYHDFEMITSNGDSNAMCKSEKQTWQTRFWERAISKLRKNTQNTKTLKILYTFSYILCVYVKRIWLKMSKILELLNMKFVHYSHLNLGTTIKPLIVSCFFCQIEKRFFAQRHFRMKIKTAWTSTTSVKTETNLRPKILKLNEIKN